MQFSKILSATAAVGIAGALAFGATSTAHAATPTATPKAKASTQADDRLEGQFILADRGFYFYGIDANLTAGIGNNNLKPIEQAQARAITVSVPAVNTVGKIMYDGNCLGSATAGSATPAWVGCTTSTAVDFTVYSDGRITSTFGTLGFASASVGDPVRLSLTQPGNLFVLLNLDSFAPEAADTTPVAITGPTAGQTVTTKRPVITGTGQPGANVSVATQSGKNLGTVTVGTDGTWSLTPTSDIANAKPTLTVTQTATDGTTTTATVTFTINADQNQGLTIKVDSVDADAMTAMLSGTGTAGDTVTLTGPAGAQTVVVGSNGTWSATVSGLAAGDNTITATDGTDTVTVTATIMPSPIVNPMIAGGAGLAALLALGTTMIIRRKTAA